MNIEIILSVVIFLGCLLVMGLCRELRKSSDNKSYQMLIAGILSILLIVLGALTTVLQKL